jgi:hypothetical protein
MIRIYAPNNNIQERQYIIDVIFGEFLGLKFKLFFKDNQKHWEILLENKNHLIIEDHFFNRYPSDLGYLSISSVPSRITYFESELTPEKNIPVIYGFPDLSVNTEDDYKIVRCGVDIMASAFFMLTRWEEYVVPDRDKYNRFPAIASLSFRNHFLERPIVNEYVEFLWNILEYLKISQNRKIHFFRKNITCDVDHVFHPSLKNLTKAFKKSLLLFKENKNINKSIQFLNYYFKKEDPYYNMMHFIMKENEKMNNKVIFFFIPYRTNPYFDPETHLENPLFRKLLKIIHQRGHLIGMHPGYDAYNDPDIFQTSYNHFITILEREKINQPLVWNRQHFLRWNITETPLLIDQNEFKYDSTLSYADRAGFRTGTCWEYPLFDLLNRKKLKLKEIPLIVMESTIISKTYEGLGYTKNSMEKFLYFKEICKKYNGTFTLLWHNSSFENVKDKDFYLYLIQ